ncbi:MAG: pantetheine-phosphate adenylyltransferase, partial [Firmicutes bacterium]|nr:pantetheine-phosphate adenylyltransferase [Bacillota bacterium]
YIAFYSFSGLLVNFMKKKNCNVIVKGLRAVSDFEVEFQMALMNRKLDPSVETVFFMTSNRYAFLSSSSVREIASFGKSVEGLVPRFVELKLKEKYSKSRKRGGK